MLIIMYYKLIIHENGFDENSCKQNSITMWQKSYEFHLNWRADWNL